MKKQGLLKESIIVIVDSQLAANDPPETRQTFDRLLSEGHSEEEAKRLIGCVVAAKLFDILEKKESFNSERFVQALNKLPTIPED
jgi:hypothetical protein